MKGYTEVRTQDELDAFDHVVDGFFDAVVKEAHVLNRSHVHREDSSIAMGDGFDVQLIIQTQNRDFEVEVVLRRVTTIHLDSDILDKPLMCSVIESGVWPPREIRIGALRGAELFYRTRPKSGSCATLGSELPSPQTIAAVRIQQGWRQCSGCRDAWEEPEHLSFSRCPSCGALTELVEPDAGPIA